MRFCPFCPYLVETEAHFLFSCPAYKPLRAKIMDSIDVLTPNFRYYTEDRKIQYFLTDMDYSTTNYIISIMELREF